MKQTNKYFTLFILFLILSAYAGVSAQDNEKYPGKKFYCDFERDALRLAEESENQSAENIMVTNEEDYQKLISWLESHQSFVTIYSDRKKGGRTFFMKESGGDIVPVIASDNFPEDVPLKVSLNPGEHIKMDELLIYDENLK